MQPPCEQIAQTMGELFICSPTEGYIRIRTPYLYPDGDVIDLFLKEGDTPTLTDLGETLRWLRMQTTVPKKSLKQRQLIDDICLNHGVEFYRGMLMIRLRNYGDLSLAVTRLSQAALRIADIWFTFRNRSIESVTDEVEEYLEESHIPFERGEHLPGRSGRIWTLDFHTRHARQSALVCVLSTGSRAAAHRVAEHVVAVWHDLSHLKMGPEALRFVSLFDDTLDVWTAEDFRLVEDLSDISQWSRPDEFVEKLVA